MIGPLDHVGIAVRHLEAALARYRRLGLAPEAIEDIPAMGVRLAFLAAGPVRLELLEPTRPDAALSRFLESRGEGLHHVALRTPDILLEIRRLRDEGFDLIDLEPRTGALGRKVAFVHPRSVQGVLLELVEVPDGPS